MMYSVDALNEGHNARIELPTEVLFKLIKTGLLHVADCRSLDLNTKNTLWKLVLDSSASTYKHDEGSH